MKNSIKFLSFIPVLFIMIIPPFHPVHDVITTTIQSDKKLLVGEDLTYVVRYSFIKLGEVRTKVLDKKIIDNKTYYRTVAFIDSYSGVPFVSLHQIYRSTFTSNYFSNSFTGLIRYDDYTSYTDYNFDYKHKLILIKKGKVDPPTTWTDSTAAADTLYQDGLSILYYARMNCGTKKTVNLPCFVT